MAMARPAVPPVEWRSSAFREAQTRYAPPRRALKVSASLVTILAAGGAAALLLSPRAGSDVPSPDQSSAPVSPPTTVPSAAPPSEERLPQTAFVLFPPVAPSTATDPTPVAAPPPRQSARAVTRQTIRPELRSTPVATPAPPPVAAETPSDAFAESFPLPEPADLAVKSERPSPAIDAAKVETGPGSSEFDAAPPLSPPPPPEAVAAPDLANAGAAPPALPLDAEPVAQEATEPPLAPPDNPTPEIVLPPLAAAEPQPVAPLPAPTAQPEVVLPPLPPPPPPVEPLSLPEQAIPQPTPVAAAPQPIPASLAPSDPVLLAPVAQAYTEVFPALVVGTRTLGAVTVRDYGEGFATVHLGGLLGVFKLRMPEAEYARLAAAPAAGAYVGIDELRAAGLAAVFDPRKGQLTIALDPLPPAAPAR